jgi:hypothetical protein
MVADGADESASAGMSFSFTDYRKVSQATETSGAELP